MNVDEIKAQFTEWMEQAQDYFSHLNEQEKYGWIGEGVGFVILIVGVFLLVF